MNQDPFPNTGDADSQDQDRLEFHLLNADPADGYDLNAAICRLNTVWELQTQAAAEATEHTPVPSTPACSATTELSFPTSSTHTYEVERARSARFWTPTWCAVAAAVLVLAWVGSAKWLATEQSPMVLTQRDRLQVDAADVHSIDHVSKNDKPTAPHSMTNLGPKVKSSRLSKPSQRHREATVIEIKTIGHWLTELKYRKPNQRFPVLQLNEQALKDELGQWLDDWRNGSPVQRSQLLTEWRQNQAYWLLWAKRWCGTWPKDPLNQTAIEVIAAIEKDVSVPFLSFHLNNPALRHSAWTQICLYGTVDQLAQLLPIAANCDEAQTLATALIDEASPAATSLLIKMTSEPGCLQALKNVDVIWPEQHTLHCWNLLTGAQKDLHASAALLLAMIPSPQVDWWLGEQLRAGREPLIAVSVLLMRQSRAARQILADVRKHRSLASHFLSAQQQVVRWSCSTTPSPFLSPKVCEACSVSS